MKGPASLYGEPKVSGCFVVGFASWYLVTGFALSHCIVITHLLFFLLFRDLFTFFVVATDRTGFVQAERPGSARTMATGEYTQARRRSINMDMYEHTEHHVSSSITRSSIAEFVCPFLSLHCFDFKYGKERDCRRKIVGSLVGGEFLAKSSPFLQLALR
jgi:hypothetical protein